MTRIILSISFILFLTFSFAQKNKKEKYNLDYDKETGIINVNGTEVFKFTEQKNLNGGKDYTLISLDDKNLILLSHNSYKDSHAVSESNPTGNVRYYNVIFFDENKSKCQIPANFFKTMMAEIDKSNLIEEGRLNPSAVELFVAKYGMHYDELKYSR